MSKPDNFALVRKPSSAVEKAAPGAKRILSGMVADTLALTKPALTILIGDSGQPMFRDLFEVLIRKQFAENYPLKFVTFSNEDELLNLGKQKSFDLIILYVSNVRWNPSKDDLFVYAAKILSKIKSQTGKPIIAVQGDNLSKEFEGTGVIFLEAPFNVEEFRGILKANLPAQTTGTHVLSKMQPATRAPKVIPVNYENIVGEFTDFLAAHAPLIGDCSLLPYPKRTIHYAIASVLNDYESKREDTTNQILHEKYDKIIPTLRYALTRLVSDWHEINQEDKEAISKLAHFDSFPDWALPLKLKYLDEERASIEACEMAIQVIKDKVEREKSGADV